MCSGMLCVYLKGIWFPPHVDGTAIQCLNKVRAVAESEHLELGDWMCGKLSNFIRNFFFLISCAKFPFYSPSLGLMIVLLHSSLLVEVFVYELICNLASLVSFLSKAD